MVLVVCVDLADPVTYDEHLATAAFAAYTALAPGQFEAVAAAAAAAWVVHGVRRAQERPDCALMLLASLLALLAGPERLPRLVFWLHFQRCVYVAA